MFTAHLARSVFWHSVIVTLGEVFSAAHQGGETRSRGCQLRLAFVLYLAKFPLGLLFYVEHGVWKQAQWHLFLISGALPVHFQNAKVKFQRTDGE